jgi:hypothetical protein
LTTLFALVADIVDADAHAHFRQACAADHPHYLG